MKQKEGTLKLKRFLLLFPLLVSLIAMSNEGLVLAQTGNDPWSSPLNLSHSGSTSNPVAVRDANGIIHVIWQDKIAGKVYTRLEGDQWSQPIAMKFPFGDAIPRLLADGLGFIHAFWINQSGSLLYTRMSASSNSLVGQKSQILAKDALAYDVTLDSNGDIQIAYIWLLDEPDFPAGVYYRRSDNGGGSWSEGKLLYQSQYFRGLENEAANVSIASAGEGAEPRLYVAWDNRPRKRVYFSMSTDSGVSWSEPKEIQGANASLNYASPYGIEVGAIDKNVLLIWQIGDPTSTCRQYYQWSMDGGENWESPRRMLDEYDSCPQGNQLLSNNKGLIFLLTSQQDQLYLGVWNGSQWGKFEFQRTLTGFEDVETHDMVLLACQQPVLLSDEQLLVVGCDQGNGGDIWATSRPMGDVNSWYPAPPNWNKFSVIGESKSEILSPVMIADLQGNFHLLWTQMEGQNITSGGAQPRRVIYYAQNKEDGWTRPVGILGSPEGDADQLSLAIDSENRLFAVWQEKQSRRIFFSWANSENANNPSEWISPQSLPVVQDMATSPNIQVDKSGTIYVVYAIPINENRGIYLTASTDEGKTWSRPTKAVEAVSTQWDIVDQPQLSITSDGHLHLIWKPYYLVGVSGPFGIYYTHSEDGGLNWSQPESMVDGPVYWSSVVSIGGSTLILVWQEKTFTRFDLKYRISWDGGLTWERTDIITSFGSSQASANMAADRASRVNLVLVDQDFAKNFVLKHWTWKGEGWLDEGSLDLGLDPTILVGSINLAVSMKGWLGVTFNLGGLSGANYKLEFTDRSIEVPQDFSMPAPTLTPTTVPTSTPIIVITEVPTQALPTPLVITPQPLVTGRSQRDLILGAAMILVVLGVTSGLAVLIILRNR